MTPDYWQRQQTGKPLFPNLLWSRPENRRLAGKLLIIGGNAHGFAAPAEAYAAAEQAGIGVARVLLPDALRRTVGQAFEAGEFAPSTPSGSFSRKALAEWLAHAAWADAVLVDGDIGHNSETAIVLESFLQKYPGQLILSGDTVDNLVARPAPALLRTDCLVVTDFSQLQKMTTAMHSPQPLTSNMDTVRFIEALHMMSLRFHAGLLVQRHNQLYLALQGRVADSSDPRAKTTAGVSSASQLAAAAATWWLQNPSQPFEAIMTSLSAD